MKFMTPDDFISQNFPSATLIKKGGQKSVYYFESKIYGRTVIKVGIGDPGERINREVAVLKTINSPYYPKIHGFNCIPGEYFCIIEEYIDSQPLSALLACYTDQKDALQLLSKLIEGLKIIWSNGIVHRDLKPDNILIRPTGSPVIIDLGIARLLEEESITSTARAFGPATLIYASPEQILNLKDLIDFRSDQFNLGIILGELLLKTHPFCQGSASINSIVNNILNDNWRRYELSTITTPRTFSVIEKLLGNRPYNRYKTPNLFEVAVSECIKEL